MKKVVKENVKGGGSQNYKNIRQERSTSPKKLHHTKKILTDKAPYIQMNPNTYSWN